MILKLEPGLPKNILQAYKIISLSAMSVLREKKGYKAFFTRMIAFFRKSCFFPISFLSPKEVIL